MAEALAQYGSLRAVEAVMGHEAAERYRTDWGDGDFSAAGYFRYAAAGYDQPLADLPEAPDGQRMMYVKGMLVWDMLSREVGRDRFRHAMRRLTTEHRFASISWPLFWDSFARYAGRDLETFHDQWFARAGAPDWRVTWSDRGHSRGVEVTVTQRGTPFDVTADMLLIGAKGERYVRPVHLEGERTDLVFRPPFEVRDVVLDPEEHVLHWTDEYRTIASVMVPVTQALRQQLLGRGVDVRPAVTEAFSRVPAADHFGLKFMLHYRLAEALMQRGAPDADVGREFGLALENATRCTDRLPWVYFHLARFARTDGDSVRLRWAVSSAVAADGLAGGHTGVAPLALGLLPR
jgi:hypothetical protein